jgi:putative protease
VAEKKPGEYFPLVEDETGTFILNSRNLCMIEYIPQLFESGVDSFKIEGRQRGPHYISIVTKVYREAIDAFIKDPNNYHVNPAWIVELQKLSERGCTTGFYFGKPTADTHSYDVR